jgi:outer membrane biosynthesis protein TonB
VKSAQAAQPVAPAAAQPRPKTPVKASKEESAADAERKKQRRQDRRDRQKEAKAEAQPSKKSDAKPGPARPVIPKVAPKTVAAPTPAVKSGPKKDVNALLATLNKNTSAKSDGVPVAAAGNLPQRLSSSKLRSTLRRKRGTFGGCYKKMPERPAGGITVNTSLVVAGSGTVKSVRITSGGGASAVVLRCISSALKNTKFPPFAAAQMSVNYPITLR